MMASLITRFSRLKAVITWCLLASGVSNSLQLHAKPITTFIPRSQGANTARELVGWQRQLFRPFTTNYAALAFTFEYTRSRDTECLARNLLTSSCLTFAGSQNPNRVDGSDLVADYFGLPTDFHGTLAVEPRIENIIIDLNYYFGLNEWINGLYLRVHTPITHTRWTVGLDSCLPCADKFRGCTQFPGCYMFSGTPAGQPDPCPTIAYPNSLPVDGTRAGNRTATGPCPVNESLTPPDYLKNQNCTTQSIREALSGTFTFGDMIEPWNYGRFDFCPRSKTGLADIDVILGWNFLESDYAHCGFYALGVIPTGNRPKAKYIFEPLVGNGRHWEAGIGFTTHASWQPFDSDGNMGFYIDAQLTHMFRTHQVRSFDFTNNGPLSRYMLLKEYSIDDTYSQRMINAINFATRNCEVSIRLKSDASVKLFFVSSGWELDLGYNFYFQERECIGIRTDCPCGIDSRRFGVKGLEGVCCQGYELFAETADLIFVRGTDEPTTGLLNATQQDATMFTAVLPTSAPVVRPAPGQTGAICFSWNGTQTVITADENLDTVLANGYIVANTAATPKIISCADLNPLSAAQGRMMTHKFFTHLSYTFENSCYSPHFGIGCEIEFDGHHHNGLSQWGAWLKGGLLF